jgi:hypothetical protein
VTEVQTVSADFDGDDVEDRVVDVVCQTSSEAVPHLLVGVVGDRRDVLVDVKTDPVVGDTNLSIDDAGRVLFRGRGYSPSADECCPDLDVRRTFQWKGTGFVEVKE